MPPHSPNTQEYRPRWPASRSTKIGVIGAGDIGLSTALEFARRGYHVVCADDGEAVAAARLERARRKIAAARLRFTCSSADAARHGDVIVMAVGGGDEATARLLDAAVEVAQNLSGPAVIVDKSADSPALADQVAQLMARNSEHEIVVVSEPHLARRALRVFWGSSDATA